MWKVYLNPGKRYGLSPNKRIIHVFHDPDLIYNLLIITHPSTEE